MEFLGIILIFWYGILHAFGADHLTAIADFSIGKNKRKTMLITTMFAIGHGISLFIFAKLLETYSLSADILAYGDVVSALVILGMGVYLLFLVYTNRINLNKHIHDGVEHVHIYFGREHSHSNSNKDVTSAFTIGTLMGIGGVRGMLVTLGMVESSSVDFTMVLAFTLGVMLIFIGFGSFILYINKNLLNSKQNIRKIFTTAGIISVFVGTNILLG